MKNIQSNPERAMHTAMATTLSAHYIALGACIASGFAGVKAHAVPELLALESIRSNPPQTERYCKRMRENGVDGSDALPFLEDRRRWIMVAEQTVQFQLKTTRRSDPDSRKPHLRAKDANALAHIIQSTGMFVQAVTVKQSELGTGVIYYALKANDGNVFNALGYADGITLVTQEECWILFSGEDRNGDVVYGQALVTSDFTFTVSTIERYDAEAYKSKVGSKRKISALERHPDMLPVSDTDAQLEAQRTRIFESLTALPESFILSKPANAPLRARGDADSLQEVLSKNFELIKRNQVAGGNVSVYHAVMDDGDLYFQVLMQSPNFGLIDAAVDSSELTAVRGVMLGGVINLSDVEMDDEDEDEDDEPEHKSKPKATKTQLMREEESKDRIYTPAMLDAADLDDVYHDLAIKLGLAQSSLIYSVSGEDATVRCIKTLEDLQGETHGFTFESSSDWDHIKCMIDGIPFTLKTDDERVETTIHVLRDGHVEENPVQVSKEDAREAYIQNLNHLHAELDWELPAILDGKKLRLTVADGDEAARMLEQRGVKLWPSPKYSGLKKDVFDCEFDGIKFRLTLQGTEAKIKLRGSSKRYVA